MKTFMLPTSILAKKGSRLSYQAGLRAEWTDVRTTLQETNEVNPREYVNLFPSAHVTYNLPKQNASQGSYSGRVGRPFYNDLSPFITFSDSSNYFSGNPDLDPEFSNAFEIGHIKYFEKGSFTSALYHRSTRGKIERIRSVDADGNSTTLPQNLNSEEATGAEFTSEFSLFSWWKLDMNFNFFYADIDGTNILSSYNNTTYSWFARQTSRFMLANQLDIQLRGNYEAPQKTAQGERLALTSQIEPDNEKNKPARGWRSKQETSLSRTFATKLRVDSPIITMQGTVLITSL